MVRVFVMERKQMKNKRRQPRDRVSFSGKRFTALMEAVIRAADAMGQLKSWGVGIGKACEVACARCKPKIRALMTEDAPSMARLLPDKEARGTEDDISRAMSETTEALRDIGICRECLIASIPYGTKRLLREGCTQSSVYNGTIRMAHDALCRASLCESRKKKLRLM